MTDLRELINSLIEKKGRFQIILIILICLNSIEVGINHTVTSFHIYTPEYYCRDDPAKNTDPKTNCNSTCEQGYQFDETDDFSVAREFELVCDRKFLGSLVNTLYFVGVTLGSLVCSSLCDLWGRKKLVLACMYVQALMSIGVYASTNLIWFSIFRVLQGFFIQGLQTCSYTLMLEYCPGRFRTMAAVFWELNWAVGLGVLGLASYLVPDWRHLTLVLMIPTAISLAYFWIIPESISWLYANKRYNEALRLIKVVAKRNNNTNLLEECNKVQLGDRELVGGGGGGANQNNKNPDENDPASERVMGAADSEPDQEVRLTDIFRNPILRKHLIVMIIVWFSVTLSYYGILFFLPGLGGPRHANFLIGAAIEAGSYIVAYFVLSRFGRRLPMTFYQFINMILLIVMGILHVYKTEDSTILSGCLNTISLIAKGLAVSCFCGMFIYCSELIPTQCRGVGLGLCGFSARVGSLLAPQLMLLTEIFPAYVPLLIMSALLLLSGSATLFVPETLSSNLPDTIQEANELWGKKR